MAQQHSKEPGTARWSWSWQSLLTGALFAFIAGAIFFDVLIGVEVETVVWAPHTDNMEVTVDGYTVGVVPPSARTPVRTRLRRASTIELRQLRTSHVTRRRISARSASRVQIIPGVDDQCFVVVQHRPYWFEVPDQPPKVVRRIRGGEPFSIARREPWPLPRIVLYGPPVTPHPIERVDTIDELPCALIDSADAQIIGYLKEHEWNR